MIKAIVFAIAGTFAAGIAWADNVAKSDRMLCSSAKATICFETGECFSVMPWEIDVPQFLIIDKKKKLIATPKGSSQQRTTPIQSVNKADNLLYIQGFESGRAFSIVIDERLGTLTASIARDGISVAVFGDCTDADI